MERGFCRKMLCCSLSFSWKSVAQTALSVEFTTEYILNCSKIKFIKKNFKNAVFITKRKGE